MGKLVTLSVGLLCLIVPCGARARPLEVTKDIVATVVVFQPDSIAWPGVVIRTHRTKILRRGTVLMELVHPDIARRDGGIAPDFWKYHAVSGSAEVLAMAGGDLVVVSSYEVKDLTERMPFQKLRRMFVESVRTYDRLYLGKMVSASDYVAANHQILTLHLKGEIERRKGTEYASRMWWNCGGEARVAQASSEGKLLSYEQRRALCGD